MKADKKAQWVAYQGLLRNDTAELEGISMIEIDVDDDEP